MKFKLLCCVCVLAAALAPPVLAHHSFAMFDFNKTTTFSATVTEFRWTNPHVGLLVEASPKPGAPVQIWSTALRSPASFARMAWSPKSFKPGDAVELQFYPLRDG